MGILAACMVPHPPLIIPEVGRGEERKISKTVDAYRKAAKMIAEKKPETIIVISPHQIMYADYFHISPGTGAKGDFEQFQAGDVKFEVTYDTELVKELCHRADMHGIAAGAEGERTNRLDHGTMIPLYFIDQYLQDYKIVRIGLSGQSLAKHYEFGTCIKEAVDALGRKAVLVASGDLSHRLKADGPYGYQKEGPEYDRQIMEVMAKAEFQKLVSFSEDFCSKAGECGHRSFTIMAGTLNQMQVRPKQLSYEGPFGVGYGVCTYEILEQTNQEDAYVQLARKTIETYVRTGKQVTIPQGLPKEMYADRAGVFVSIKEEGRLRGCIGTIYAVQDCIAAEIIHNAISASTEDPRFSPIRPQELDKLTISVDVLGDMEKIDSPDFLDVKRYGVVVTNGYRRGLLLPNLEGVDSVEDQIAIAKQKAGIGYTEEAQLERFEVIRHF